MNRTYVNHASDEVSGRRGNRMKRRQFITLLGGVTTWQFASRSAQAELTGKVYRLGFLMGMDPQPRWIAAFKQGLQAFGWIEGQNIAIEYRLANGYFDRLPGLCADLVSLPVDLLLAVSAPETSAAKQCTSSIPIVFAIHGDPLGTGDVQSLAHPGGNATGMSQTQGDLIPKLLGLLKEAVPQISRVAVLWNPAVRSKAHDKQEAEMAAPELGIVLNLYAVRAPTDFDGAFTAIREIDRMRC